MPAVSSKNHTMAKNQENLLNTSALAHSLYSDILRFVKSKVNQTEDAEDLTQEVFCKIAESNLEEISHVKAWIYTVARNTVIDYYRSKKHITSPLPENELPDFPVEADEASFNHLNRCIRPFMEQLPTDLRNIMVWSELEGKPQKTIAEQLGMNYVTLRSKIQRGRKKLGKMISQCCQAGVPQKITEISTPSSCQC